MGSRWTHAGWNSRTATSESSSKGSLLLRKCPTFWMLTLLGSMSRGIQFSSAVVMGPLDRALSVRQVYTPCQYCPWPREAFVGASSLPNNLRDGNAPAPLGTFPLPLGASPVALGAFPFPVGALPSAMGTLPSSVGAFPSALGASPSSLGTFPPPQGAFPLALGTLPLGMGTFPGMRTGYVFAGFQDLGPEMQYQRLRNRNRFDNR